MDRLSAFIIESIQIAEETLNVHDLGKGRRPHFLTTRRNIYERLLNKTDYFHVISFIFI